MGTLLRAVRGNCRTVGLALAVAIAPAVVLPIAGPSPAAHAAQAYYVAENGNDQTGTGSAASPFRTLARLNALPLVNGDDVFLRRGDVWAEKLTVAADIDVNAYGDSSLPVPAITGGGANICVEVTGTNPFIANVRVSGCGVGFALKGSSPVLNRVVVEDNTSTGIRVYDTSNWAKVSNSTIQRNPTGFQVYGTNATVTGSTFTGNETAVHVAGGQGVTVDHNTATGGIVFAKLATTTTTGTTDGVTLAYNHYWSAGASARFATLHGAGATSGLPVKNVRIRNNTAHLTGSLSKAVLCSNACTSTVLSEIRGNVLSSVGAAFQTDGVTGIHNVFAGGAPTKPGGYPLAAGEEVHADPDFVDAASGNLRVLPSSPAVDLVEDPQYTVATSDLVGTPVWSGSAALVDGDGDGTPRVDAGAYEVEAPALKPALRGLVTTDVRSFHAEIPNVAGPEFASIKIDWNVVEPTDDSFDFTSIEAILDDPDGAAGTRTFLFRVRIMAGIRSPWWVKAAPSNGPAPPNTTNKDCAHGIEFYPDSRSGDPGCVPRYWLDDPQDQVDVQAEYIEMMAAFAAEYEDDPRVVDVVNGACTTAFAEPFIVGAEDTDSNQGAVTTTTDRLFDEGYTKLLHKACITDTTAALMALFPTTRVSMSGHNAWQYIEDVANDGQDAKLIYGDWQSEKALWTALRGNYGNHLVIEDHGLEYDSNICPTAGTPDAPDTWYCYLRSLPRTTPHGMQFTAPPAEDELTLAQWMPTAADNGVAMNACYLEFKMFSGLSSTKRLATHNALLDNCDL